MSEAEFNQMLKKAQRKRYAQGKLIFREGEPGNALYIILEGSIRVFTYDSYNEKIPLARLNRGDYFGEQALLGYLHKSRNANIETILKTTVLKIDEKYFKDILKHDEKLEAWLKKYGVMQAFQLLTSASQFYSEIESIVSNMPSHNILEYIKGETIFNKGDEPDNVYIILLGEVKLVFPVVSTNKSSTLILHKGHLFGELAVLNHKKRAGTAIANSNVRLLSINGDDFKNLIPKSAPLQKLLETLSQVYQLPLKGSVEQYLGHVKEIGPTITTIYKLDNGRSIISTKCLNQNLFTMTLADQPKGDEISYEKDGKRLVLEINGNNLIGIKAYGIWEGIPNLCLYLIDQIKIDESTLKNFKQTGVFPTIEAVSRLDDQKLICTCMSVTKKRIQEEIDKGVRDLDAISNATGACTSCRMCKPLIEEMLGMTPWISASIRKLTQHNNYINSYLIEPANASFQSFKPGQHLIVQAKIGEFWIERPYTISGLEKEGTLRITIKKENQGMFTQWLFNQEVQSLLINVTHPSGEFVLNLHEETDALCFAGGIGITPFITFAKELYRHQSPKKMHLLYTVLTPKDFIFENEFEDLLKKNPLFTITYRTTEVDGLLSSEDIMNLVASRNHPEIYICGPKGFIDLIRMTLETHQYPKHKIRIEEFVHAGSPKP